MDSIQDEIIEEFSVFDDWLDKYDYLIGLSETLPAIAPEHRTERYLIEGCQSRVWVDAQTGGRPGLLRGRQRRHNNQGHHRVIRSAC